MDGVYEADPLKDPTARRYSQLEYTDLLRDQLKVIDAAAVLNGIDNFLYPRSRTFSAGLTLGF